MVVQFEYTFAGSSEGGAYVALANHEGVRVIHEPNRRLEGTQVAFYPLGQDQDSIKTQLPEIESLADTIHPENTLEKLIPMDQGQALLLQSRYGIYLVEQEQVILLHPDMAEIQEYEYEDTQLSMGHAAVSCDGRWIAWGSQMSSHMLLDRQNDKRYEVEPESSYTHCAAFSQDSRVVWFNACHFYNGVTIQVPLDNIADRKQESGLLWTRMHAYML